MSDRSHRRWHDVRTMLTDWLAWLDDTQRWAETTAVADASSELAELPVADPEVTAEPGATDDEAMPRADLHALLGAMTALRQEVNLQTRSARRDREQASDALETLSSAVEQLSREAEAEDTSPDIDAVHVDALLELHDALSRAERQASQVIAATIETLGDWRTRLEREPDLDDVPEEPEALGSGPKPRAFGRLREWWGGAAQPVDESVSMACEARDRAAVNGVAWGEIGTEAGRMADRLEGLVTGYRLSLQRLERMLSTCGIEPIPCLGQSVDPELMEVVQIVADTTKPPGVVTDEVRCGYRRYGQVYRFAQVVATRFESPTDEPTD